MDEGTIKSYVVGFALSILLTLAAFFVVVYPVSLHLAGGTVLVTILVLAVAQLVVQMLFFLHLGAGAGARWRMGIFFATLGLVIIVVVGSLWIINHLNYNMMLSPTEMQQYINNQQGF